MGADSQNQTTAVPISGVWLRRVGDKVIVSVEIDGRWRDVIVEFYDGQFSHIVETSGIESAQETQL